MLLVQWLHLVIPNCDRGVVADSAGIDISKFPASPFAKSTRSALEFDIQAYQILNRHLMTARSVPPILEIPPALPPFPATTSGSMPTSTPEPLVHSIRELWEAERARRTSLGLDPSPPMPVEVTLSQRGPGREGQWEGSQRHKRELQARIEVEKGQWGPKKTFEMWEQLAWTTLESTEMLWEPQWRTIRKEPQEVPGPEQESSLNLSNPDANSVGSQGSSYNPFESSPDTGEDDVSNRKGKSSYNVDLDILSSQVVAAAIDQEKAFERGHVLAPFQSESGRRYRESKTPQKSLAGYVKFVYVRHLSQPLSQPHTTDPLCAARWKPKLQIPLAHLVFCQPLPARVLSLPGSGVSMTYLI